MTAPSERWMERATALLGKWLTGEGPDRRGGKVVLAGSYIRAQEALAAEFESVAAEVRAEQRTDDEKAADEKASAANAIIRAAAEARGYRRGLEAAIARLDHSSWENPAVLIRALLATAKGEA